MGLFDIFRRHKKKEPEKTTEEVASTSPSEQVETKEEPASSAPASQEPVKIPPAVSHEEKINPDGSRTVLHDGIEKGIGDDQPVQSAEKAAAEESQPESATSAVSENESTSDSATASDEQTAAPVTSAAQASDDQAKTEEPAEDKEESPAMAEKNETAAKYDQGLAKSRTGFGARLNKFLANFRHVDEDFFDNLEDMLIESDVGYDMAMKLSDQLREEVKLQNAKSKQDVSNVIIEKMVELYDEAGQDENPDLTMAKEGPTVIMFVGVNGAGKTTTVGKMAALFKQQGKKVLLAAADTFRAGATEQLDVWAKRDGVDIVVGPENGDPAAVVFDAVKKAKDEDYDILFVDTAGRLQNKVNLMNELAKMKRILTREIPDAPHEVLLVLDATTGQNALNQAKLFKESTAVTGIVLTKLDGTARGGIVLAIRNELHLPVKYVGLGEKVDDLQKFDAGDFVYGLFKGLVEVD